MAWQRKLTKILGVFFLAILVASCDGSGCVEADEFDNQYVIVKANPISDGISGVNYDDINGGQVANWHDTGLRSNGQGFLIQISGGWIPWYGSAANQDSLNILQRCNFCAKKSDSITENCICYALGKPSDNPTPELAINGRPRTDVDCSKSNKNTPQDQDDPTKCSCTLNHGSATDPNVFHFPLNYYDKNHVKKLPDDQSSACKYEAGMGLYLGLFGSNSVQVPLRAYHLFSQAPICNITRNSNNECKDASGADRTKYVFRSANNQIFVKDDQQVNDGTDTNAGDDILHKPNEFVKLIIYDRYYSDNFGQYNVAILAGVTRDGDTGLLEYLVGIVEDAMLGQFDVNSGVRTGGVLEFLYKFCKFPSYFMWRFLAWPL